MRTMKSLRIVRALIDEDYPRLVSRKLGRRWALLFALAGFAHLFTVVEGILWAGQVIPSRPGIPSGTGQGGRELAIDLSRFYVSNPDEDDQFGNGDEPYLSG